MSYLDTLLSLGMWGYISYSVMLVTMLVVLYSPEWEYALCVKRHHKEPFFRTLFYAFLVPAKYLKTISKDTRPYVSEMREVQYIITLYANGKLKPVITYRGNNISISYESNNKKGFEFVKTIYILDDKFEYDNRDVLLTPLQIINLLNIIASTSKPPTKNKILNNN